MDAYKYYTKEQYEEFGSILETAQQIDARLKDNKIENIKNRRCQNRPHEKCQSYRS